MKPHLPLKLRAALLAAIFAVSFTAYAPAWAEETGDTLTETKVYEHNEPWTDRITGSLTLDSYAEVNISGFGEAISIGHRDVVSITNSGNILFKENSDRAIYNDYGTLTFSGNGDITFSGNSATSSGKAIDNSHGTLTFSDNEDIIFSGNSGRAIDNNHGTLTFSDNEDIIFSGNSGRAIVNSHGTLTFSGNGDITFSGNSATGSGGAIYNDYGTLTFSGNGDITFSGNSTASSSYGGAIYNNYGTLTFSGNGDITFSGNSTTDSGGAIYNSGTLTFSGNDSVLFEKNHEERNGLHRLRSIYSYKGSVYLAAKEGGYIAFKDSLYSASGVECFFNAHLDENGSLTPAYGEIIFTGESTEADLAEIMGYTPTETQITESRTSYVGKAATLYGGTLSIREQAVLEGVGLTVQTSASKGGTRVLLRNGTLSMSGGDIVFQSGTVLDMQGQSSLAGNVTMAADSTLQFTLGETSSPILTLTGTLVQEGNLLISISGNAAAGTYTLLSIDNTFDKTSWTESSVSVMGASFADLSWDEQGKILRLDYKGTSGLATALVWNGSSGGTWNNYTENWQAAAGNDSNFEDGKHVRFTDAGAGTITITGTLAPGSVVVESSIGKDYTFNGIGKITGKASLTKLGAGTLTIRNANNYTGGTTIREGTLVVRHAKALGHGVVTLDGGTLDLGVFYPLNDFVLNEGTVVLRKAEGNLQLGKVTLGGNGINIDYGDLSDYLTGESHTLATLGSGSAGDTAKLTLVNSNLVSEYSLEIKDGALLLNLEEREATTLTWDAKQETWGLRSDGDLWQTQGGLNDGHFHDGDAVLIDVGDNITIAGAVSPRAVEVQGTKGVTIRLTGEGGMTGGCTLRKIGESTLTIETANSYTGGTVLEEGMLRVSHSSALGFGRVTLKGGMLDMGGLVVGNTIQVASGSLATIANGENYSGTLLLSGGSLRLEGTFGGDLILSGGLLDLTGLASATLGSNMMTTALTQINVGDLSGLTEGDNILLTLGDGSFIDTTKLEIVGLDAITDWNKSLELKDNKLVLVLSEVGAVDPPVSNKDMVLDNVVTPGHLDIDDDEDSTITGSGSIAGDGRLDKDGKGNLTINTENPDWTGDINVNGGTITAGSDTALGTGVVTLAGGNLNMGGQGLGNNIAVEKDATVSGGGDYQGTLTLSNGTLSGSSLNIAAGKDFVLENGSIENKLTGDGGVIKNTDGSVTLNGSNSYGGGTTINGGTLVAGNASAFGTGDVTVSNGTLDLNGKAIANNILLNDGATLQNCGAAGNIAVAAGAGIRLGNHSIGSGQTMSFGGNNSVAGKVSFGGGTLVLGSPNLTFTDVVSIVPGSVTTLDVSAFGNTLSAGGSTGLIDFAGGLKDYTEGCLSIIGVGEGLTPALQFDTATGKLVLNVSAATKPDDPITPPDDPVTLPSCKVDPASLGGNSRGIYTQLVAADKENRYGDVLGALAHTAAGTTDTAELKKLLGQVSGCVYTTQMSAQIDGNRAAMGTLRDLMGYGQEPVRPGCDYRFAVQATSALSSTDGDADAPGYDRRGFGGLLMAETSVAEGTVAGLSVGYEHATVEAEGSDKWESDDTRINAHLMLLGKTWQSRSILGIGMHEYDMKRNVNAGGVSGTAQSSPGGFSVNFMEELACLVKLDEESSVEPFLRIESSYNSIDGATESGTLGNAALELDSQDAWATTVTLGTRYVQQFTMGGVLPTSRLMAEAGISKSIGSEGETLTARFAGDPAHGFRLTPAERDRWGVTLGGSLLLPLDNTQMINIGAKLQLRGSSTEVNANAGYQIVF